MADDIVPDDKNWTWVLERRCGDCGFDAPSFAVAGTAAMVREIGARWVTVLARADVRERPRPDVWSPLEYACHVRDVFRIMDMRLGLMLDSHDPTFENWDQDATAVEDDYGSQDPAAVAAELKAAAETFAMRYAGVSGEQWARRGFRSDGSVFTVESLARYMLHDPLHHLWDVGEPLPAP
jgi:hypothetical protein